MDKELKEAFSRMIDSGWDVLGNEVAEFEKEAQTMIQQSVYEALR